MRISPDTLPAASRKLRSAAPFRAVVPFAAASLFAATLFSAGCGKEPQKVLIGVNAELGGSIPATGQACRDAAELAVKEINAAGGLQVGAKKLPVELVVEDNGDKPAAAASATQKLASAGVVAMVGPNLSRNAVPAAEVAEAYKLPMVTPWSTASKVTVDPRTAQAKKFVFRTSFNDDFQGVVAANFAVTHLKSTKPAVLFDSASEYNKGIAEVYGRSLQTKGVEVVAFESYSTGAKEFSAQIAKILKSGADSLFLPNYYDDVPAQVREARKAGFTGAILGSDSWGSPELLAKCGADCEGSFFTTHWAADSATPKAQEFIAKFQAAKGRLPDDIAALTWDSFQLLFKAIEAAGKLDKVAIRDALAKTANFEGVTGSMEYKGTGDPVKSAVVIQVKGGKFVYSQSVKP